MSKKLTVLMINGSPHANGCTYTALCEIAAELEKHGIGSEIIHVGNKPYRGCMGCGVCRKTNGQCAFGDDGINDIVEKAKNADAIIVGSPVHYAAASGAISCVLDRVFYSGGKHFAYKPGAAILSCRRGGATASLDQLNKYFLINKMPVVSSQYWNMVHGNTPDEVKQDLEGMQTMRTLAANMAWLLKCIEAGKDAGIEIPTLEKPLRTNFIR